MGTHITLSKKLAIIEYLEKQITLGVGMIFATHVVIAIIDMTANGTFHIILFGLLMFTGWFFAIKSLMLWSRRPTAIDGMRDLFFTIPKRYWLWGIILSLPLTLLLESTEENTIFWLCYFSAILLFIGAIYLKRPSIAKFIASKLDELKDDTG